MTHLSDIRLRPPCANGLSGHPECRSLIQALIDMGWSAEKRETWLREFMNKEQAHVHYRD